MLTNEEIKWITSVLEDYEPGEIDPSYFYRLKTKAEREQNKSIVREQLDKLIANTEKFHGRQIEKFKVKSERDNHEHINVEGIYIILNEDKNLYYIGQAEEMVSRVYRHFQKDKGNPEIYQDYNLGDSFIVSLIPLGESPFKNLNELEDNAIRAYDSFHNGYNRVEGNIMDRYIFGNEEIEKAAFLMLDRIKQVDEYKTLTNSKKRMKYVKNLTKELSLPHNSHFILGLAKIIKEDRKVRRRKEKR